MQKHQFESVLTAAGNEINHAASNNNWTPVRLSENVQLRPYQLLGLQWLGALWETGFGGILADEMGLGKTLQAISFLAKTWEESHHYLIVVPLSLVMNWTQEWTTFAPLLIVKSLVGNSEQRMECIQELLNKPFDVLITTFEVFLKEVDFLKTVEWTFLVIDEAHRLKNSTSQIHQHLKELNCKGRLLLTGTPVQNNLEELFSLLHFCNPSLFDGVDVQDFILWYQNASEQEKLANLIRPFVLRRIKEEVVQLPKSKEIVLRVQMTQLQKDLYKSILTKNFTSFEQISGLMNVIMQLRKCANHPYLFGNDSLHLKALILMRIDGIEPEPFQPGEHLVTASSKLVVLDQLLEYMKTKGHRVLIFSQMTHMLDILQDYLDMRQHIYERLDGSIRGDDRYKAIKSFQDSKTFVFLLSTRAGGVGLNLTAADTVIFYDCDFNPAQDEQAAARVHRIGQDKETFIIRIICENSVDEIIWLRARRKKELSQNILSQDIPQCNDEENWNPRNSKEMFDILCYGLSKLDESSENTMIDVASILESETSNSDQQSTAEDVKDNIYIYEGHDYKIEKSILDKLILDMSNTHIDISSVTREERLRRAEINRLRKLELKQDKWKEIGYTSKAYHGVKNEKTLDQDILNLTYVTGDVTKPFRNSDMTKTVIVHVVDNSGKWDNRGVFAAINRLDPQVALGYEMAGSKDIKDLELGSCHIFQISEVDFVALLIAQKRRFELDMAAFETSLSHLCDFALSCQASVHFPRNISLSQSWYQIERTISKCLPHKGVPTFIYYFPSVHRKRQRTDSE